MEFTKKEIRPGIWHIGDGRGNFCTLVTGEREALLYDTMMGFGDLRAFVAELTPHEPTVISSHCHFDHTGGNHQFGRVMMHPAELPLMEVTLSQIPTLAAHFEADLTDAAAWLAHPERVLPIHPGQVLDLGGRSVEVIPMPGHTPGSIGLLCREERLLLAGDGISPQMCIFFPESLSPEEYRAMLRGLEAVPFDTFLCAHFDIEFRRDILEKFDRCVDIIGKKRGIDYTFPALPDKTGLFYVQTAFDREYGQLIGIVVKKA